MIEICRKDSLARNLNRMLKLFPKDYNIFPRTWCLPAESVHLTAVSFPPSFDRLNVLTPYLIVLRSYSDFQAYARAKKNKTYICKPDTGSQGKGIFISKSSKNILPGEHMICQVYISRVRVLLSQSHTLTQTHTHTLFTHSLLLSPPQPFILGGYKFDLRIYVLVTSCDPFSVFMFKEGLARFCTTKYHEPTNSNVVRNMKSSVFMSSKTDPLPRISEKPFSPPVWATVVTSYMFLYDFLIFLFKYFFCMSQRACSWAPSVAFSLFYGINKKTITAFKGQKWVIAIFKTKKHIFHDNVSSV